MKKFNNFKGFTLLEIIIAITVLSFLMLGVYSLTDGSITKKDLTIAEDRIKLQVESALHRIDLDFSHIYNPLFYLPLKKKKNNRDLVAPGNEEETAKFEVTERFPMTTKNGMPIPLIKNDEKHQLIFMTSINRRKIQNAKESHYAWVKYELRSSSLDKEKKRADYELVRYFSAFNPYAPEFNWDDLKPSVLLRDVKMFKFHFWNEKSKKYVERLNDIENKNILRAIKVEFEIIELGNPEPKLYTRTFRTIWPVFDTGSDEEEIKKSDKNNNNEIDDEKMINE